MQTIEQLAEMQKTGIDKVRMILRDQFINLLIKHRIEMLTDDEASICTDVTANASIGQLYRLANIDISKAKTFKIVNSDNEGTIYVEFCGMFGGMDLEGNIHT